MVDENAPPEPREPAAREASIQWMCVLEHPANNQTPNVMTEWVKRSDAEAYFAELRAKITQLRDAQTCVTCRGFICPPMQCGRCIETAKVPEGMPERPATITLQVKLAASERSLLQARKWMRHKQKCQKGLVFVYDSGTKHEAREIMKCDCGYDNFWASTSAPESSPGAIENNSTSPIDNG